MRDLVLPQLCAVSLCTYVRADCVEYSDEIRVFLHSVQLLLITANVLPSSPILVTLMMEALGFSETPVLTRAARHITEDGILHSHRHENFRSYMALYCH
jgi:hypothetical protein